MHANISKCSDAKTRKVIPGWDREMENARNDSLLWHYIWKQNNRPVSGHIYNIMKKCRSHYHYLLRSLKKKKKKKVKMAISKNVLKNNNYWKTLKAVRKNKFNTTGSVDGHVGSKHIANHFKQKFNKLFNSVRTSDIKLSNLQKSISNKVSTDCNSQPHVDDKDTSHCHIVSKHDVRKAISKLKTDKIDEQGKCFSNNFIYGTDLLHRQLSVLFTSMINHGYAPAEFLKSSMLPLPKGARADLSNSDMYRSIAISSLLSKILDNVIIERQQDFLSTSNYQFGFKAKSSTVLCTTMVNETIQYYTEKGGRAVYLLLLDASKAFDKVSYEKLFELLLARNVCPKIVKLLYYMYTHQKCHVRWNNKQSDPFSVSNGVKQGSVISPLLFSIYIDNLFSKLKQLGLGCHVGLTYAGAFGYADDIALVSPSIYGLKKMISICESYARDYHITFNPAKSKLLCFNASSSQISPIYLNGTPVTVVNKDKHLGNTISTDIYDRNIISNVCDFYQRSNSVISDFSICDSETLDKVHSTFCMHMYGCELWNLNSSDVQKFYIAWRKVKRRIWKLPSTTHNSIIHNITSNIHIILEKRFIKFMHNALNGNIVCRQILLAKLRCKKSFFAENYRYLSWKYNISDCDWYANITCLLGKVKIKQKLLYPVSHDASVLHDLCSMRDDDFCKMFNKTQLDQLIIDISIN